MDAGHQVHIICREPEPESISFVGKAIHWSKEGQPHLLFEKEINKSNSCILHQLSHFPVYPVYLDDKQRKGKVKTFSSLSDKELEEYHKLSVKSLGEILKAHPLDVLHTNHLVYQPVVASEACRATDTPFVIFPHGSSIEYTVRKDNRYSNLALMAITASKGIITGSKEVQNRILELYPQHRKKILRKSEIVGVGVDTALFSPINRQHRWESIHNIFEFGPFKGKSPELTRELHSRLDKGEIYATTLYRRAYKNEFPDRDLITHLKKIPWDNKIMIFVGSLTVGKGLQSLLIALPFILKNHPDIHLVIVGSGAYREVLEGLVYACSTGKDKLLDQFVEKGYDLDQNELTGPWTDIKSFILSPQNRRELFFYGKTLTEHVHFLGPLKHDLLRYLFPCGDLAVFPSVIPEAYPLVLMESLSNGVLPVVSYFSGFADELDSLLPYLGKKFVSRMKIPVDDKTRIPGMIMHISDLLADKSIYTLGSRLRKIAVENYDWKIRAPQMVSAYKKLILNSPS